jgi:hypothetical protein
MRIDRQWRLGLLRLLGVIEAKFLAIINYRCGDSGKN